MSLRGFYKVTGQRISHRHPFHGYGEGYYIEPDIYDRDIAALDKMYKGVQGFGLDAGKIWEMSKDPLMRGLFIGLTSWAIAKAVGADKSISRRIGLVSGGVEAILTAGSSWLANEIKKQFPEQTPEVAVAKGTPVP